MTTPATKVIRCYLPTGRWADIVFNRDHVADGAAGKLIAQDLTYVPEMGRLIVKHTPVAGLPHSWGAAASEAAMLAIHDLSISPVHYVLPGDTCQRTDTGAAMLCISGNGQLAADWVELGGGGGSASAPEWGAIAGDIADQSDLVAALEAKAAADHTHAQLHTHSNIAALNKIAEAGGLPTWNGSAWPSSGGGTTDGADLLTVWAFT